MWSPLMDALEGEYKLVVPHLWKCSSLVEGAGAAHEALDELGIDKVILAGLSMGGYAALEFIRLFPDRVRGAVLLNTTAYPDSSERTRHREDTLAVIEGGGYDRVLALFLESVVWSGGARAACVRGLIRKMAADIGEAGYIRSLRAIKDRGDQSKILSSLKLPTLFIAAEQDAFTPPHIAEEMAATVAGSKLAVIPNAGHMSVLENTGAAAQAVDAFLAGIG